MKRLLALYSVTMTAVLLLLTGCQSHSSQSTSSHSSGQPLTTIRVIADSEQALAAFRQEEKEIEQRFGVHLEYYYPQRLSDNLEDFLFNSKETYDIYVLFPIKIPQYVERHMLLPLDPYTAKDTTLNDVIPVYRMMYMSYQGHDYGMVYDGDAHFLFYRKDIFAQYADEYRRTYGTELRPPQTWEEYDRIARFLTRDTNGDGKIDLYGTATFGGDNKKYIWFAERFLSMGGQYFDPSTMKPLIASPTGVKALSDWIHLVDSGATPPHAMYDWIDLNHAFLDGQVAMVVQWSDTARDSFDTAEWNSKVAGLVGWTIVPGEKPGAPRGGIWIGRVLAISRQSQHPGKAWQVIQYLTSPEVSLRAVTSLNTINDPYRWSHLQQNGKGAFPTAELNQSYLQTLRESLNNTNADLMIPGSWDYMQSLDRHIALALMHKLSAAEALQQTAAEWEQITQRYGREQQKQNYQHWLKQWAEVQKK